MLNIYVCRSGKTAVVTVRTDKEDDVLATGTAADLFSVLDLTESTKFFIGGAPQDSVRPTNFLFI